MLALVGTLLDHVTPGEDNRVSVRNWQMPKPPPDTGVPCRLVIGSGTAASVPKLAPATPVARPGIPDEELAKMFPLGAEVLDGCTSRPEIVIESRDEMPVTFH